jgi:signal transduction histidine kinase
VEAAAQKILETLTRQVCQLQCGDAALLVIDCPAPELRHPLLSLLLSTTPADARMFGTLRLASFLDDEQARAACDIACQRGMIQHLSLPIDAEQAATNHYAIAPLSSSAGILGYLFVEYAGGFTRGEDSLLRDFIQSIIPDVEWAMRALLLFRMARREHCDGAASSGNHELPQPPEVLNSISIVSHELRAPLAAIKGYAGLLQAFGSEDERHEALSDSSPPASVPLTPTHRQRYLNMIMEETQRLEELIADLLDASRMQSGKLALHLTAVDVGEACERAGRRARQHIDSLRHPRPTLVCRITPHLPPIHADARRLQHILNNLLDNAIKYSPRGGTIELVADALYSSAGQNTSPQAIQIIVRDQGIGIPPDQHARLFQPFSRIDHPQVHQVQGVGLGLYITRRLVEAMQGTIDLSSQEGFGTQVTLRFPLEQAQLNDCSSTYVLSLETPHSFG